MLQYLFTAVYNDESTFSQNAEDVSLVNPEKSAFTDLLNGEGCPPFDQIKEFHLKGDGQDCWVDLETGLFYKDGVLLSVRNFIDKLPSVIYEHGMVYSNKSPRPTVLTSPRKLIYYREVRQHRVVPARFRNPLNYGLEDSLDGQGQRCKVVDRLGKSHYFPKGAQLAMYRERVMYKKLGLFERQKKDKDGNLLFDNIIEVLPYPDSTEVDFVIGWEANEQGGKNFKQLVKV